MMQLRSVFLVVLVVLLSPAEMNSSVSVMSVSATPSLKSSGSFEITTTSTVASSSSVATIPSPTPRSSSETTAFSPEPSSPSVTTTTSMGPSSSFETTASSPKPSSSSVATSPSPEPSSSFETTASSPKPSSSSETTTTSMGPSSSFETTASSPKPSSSSVATSPPPEPSSSSETTTTSMGPSSSFETTASSLKPSNSSETTTTLPMSGSSSVPPVSPALLYAGSVLAITCLLPVVVFFAAISKELFFDHTHLVHANLTLSILLMFIVYCISIGAAGGTLSRLACKFTTAFLHLFSLVPFAWLVCEMAVVLNLLVRKFRENSYKLSAAFMTTAWGVPLLVVLLSVAVGHDHYLIIDKAKDTVIACWLPSGRTDLHLWWAFLAPMIILTFVTFLLVIIGCVLWVRVHMHGVRGLTSAKEAEILKVTRRPLINTTIILPLLCGTTIFGVAASNDPTESSAHPYLFFITSVALGLSMLLLLLVNKKAYQELKWLKQEKCWGMFTCHRKGKELNVTMEMTVEQALQLDVMSVGSRVDLKEEEMRGNEEETEKGAADGNEDEKSNEARMTSKDEGGGQEVEL